MDDSTGVPVVLVPTSLSEAQLAHSGVALSQSLLGPLLGLFYLAFVTLPDRHPARPLFPSQASGFGVSWLPSPLALTPL